MSATKHTPGPWAIVRDRQHPSNRRINSPKRWHIAKVYAEGPEDDPVCLANARLIAAAPDLLETLKAVRCHLVLISGFDEQSIMITGLDEALSKAEVQSC